MSKKPFDVLDEVHNIILKWEELIRCGECVKVSNTEMLRLLTVHLYYMGVDYHVELTREGYLVCPTRKKSN